MQFDSAKKNLNSVEAQNGLGHPEYEMTAVNSSQKKLDNDE